MTDEKPRQDAAGHARKARFLKIEGKFLDELLFFIHTISGGLQLSPYHVLLFLSIPNIQYYENVFVDNATRLAYARVS